MSRWAISFSLVVGWVASAVAQTSGGMAGETVSLGALIQQGGWAMYPLGLFSLAMLYFIIRNSLMLRERAMLRPDLKDEIEAFMRRRDVAGLRALCAEHDSLMTTVLDAGMQRVEEAGEFDPSLVMEAVEDMSNEQMVGFMKPINYLSIIGGTAPMLGLLGTVSGMIKAFSVISQGGMGDPGKLAGSIGEALITTATGLVIAIPAMMAYFVFKNNFIKTLSTMGRLVGHYLNVYRFANKSEEA
tara:strand:- start:1231 stop:1959 length:729 start_codon:yes stop_codon:yes gene_type:complete